MKRVPIRLKLTAWYVAILLASLSLFGIAAFVAMRKGIEKSVDENLEGQANGVAEVMGRVIQQEPAELPQRTIAYAARIVLRWYSRRCGFLVKVVFGCIRSDGWADK